MLTIKEMENNSQRDLEVLREEYFDEGQIEDVKKEDDKLITKELVFRRFQRFIISFAIVLTIIWLLFYAFIGMTNAPNDDMSPRISGGDVLIYYRLNKKPSINDVVIFRKEGLRRVGRVIARGGDTVEIHKKGGVLVNGNKLVEHNIYESTLPYEKFQKYPVKLKKNELFILVDKRETGEDSRYFGVVKKSELQGIVIGQIRRLNF